MHQEGQEACPEADSTRVARDSRAADDSGSHDSESGRNLREAADASIAAFTKTHLIWTLGGENVKSITPSCQALSSTLAKCDIDAILQSGANNAINIHRTAKSTVTFYPYAMDAVLSEETCYDRTAAVYGIKSLCGLY